MNTETTTVDGGCLCGAVRFRIQLPTLWCAHCHCSQCRRFHGAGYVTWTGVQNDHFQLMQGAEQLRWYQSSEQAERGFCNHCGSSLLFRSSRWPGETHVALAALEGDIDRQPQANVFYDTHVKWMPVDQSLPCKG